MKHILATGILSTLALTTGHANADEDLNVRNKYVPTNFVASNLGDEPLLGVEKNFINAWGIAIRPQGAGGHFWITAKDVSYEYVGDVKESPNEKLRWMHQDDLKTVKLPVGGDDFFATSTVYSDSKDNFVITQYMEGKQPITAPAKFLFASDGGIISAWTERKLEDGTFDRPAEAVTVIDASKEGKQFFGLAISHNYDRLYAANFGKKAGIDVFGGDFRPLDIVFDTPFDSNKNGEVDAGEYAPFNIQALTTPSGANRIFVAYAKTRVCPKAAIEEKICEKDEIYAGEEDTSSPGYGRLAEFTEDGKLVKVWKDDGQLSAPWGMAFAPKNFGALSGSLLVANFGSGKITAYDYESRSYKNVLRNVYTDPLKIDKIWGLVFGNGESLGDSNALYFTAGPDDEKEGLFGSLRLATDEDLKKRKKR